MLDARLAIALEAGGLTLPVGGSIAVINPPAEAELSALRAHQLVIIDGFKPSYEKWKERGFASQVAIGSDYAAIVLSLPRSKADARAMIADAMRATRGPIIIDGQKTDGVDSILRDVKRRTGVEGPISKAHGKLFCCPEPEPFAFEDWVAGPAITPGGFWTAPGVFSADAVDPASALLVSALPDNLGAQVGDLGAGWGYLSAHILTRENVKAVHLVEANHMALECARRNVTDPRADFHWADACDWVPEAKLDCVVMNPPFHKNRAADPTLGQAFIRNAARSLSVHGHLWMVANRHLPYEETLQRHFAKVLDVGGDNRFKLFHASRPVRKVVRDR